MDTLQAKSIRKTPRSKWKPGVKTSILSLIALAMIITAKFVIHMCFRVPNIAENVIGALPDSTITVNI